VRPGAQVENTQQASRDDGFYRVDLETGRNELWVSLEQIRAVVPNGDELAGTVLYAFHVKINAQGTRVMLVARAKPRRGKYHPMLLTCRPDGGELRVVLTSREWRAGTANHPVWHPDGERILMNMTLGGTRRFALIHAASGETVPLTDKVEGIGGHPSLSADCRSLITDYNEFDADPWTGTLRHVDLESGSWTDLVTVPRPAHGPATGRDASLRVDLHPVYDRECRRICFTAAPEGRRRVFVAEVAAEGRVRDRGV
jgi:hypothetical protein